MLRELFTNKKFLSALVAAKIGVLTVLVVVMTDAVQIGEKLLMAADGKDAKDAKDAKGEKATVKADESKVSAANDSATPKRKSFLDDLLELPKIDRDAPTKEEITRYLMLADRKLAQIEQRTKDLESRERQLKIVEASIEGKLGELDKERHFFAQTIQQEKEFKDKRQQQLVEMYKKMEAKKAAPLFEAMDKDLVVYLFNNLPNKLVTKVLETMKPDKSVEISEYFGRIRSAREYDTLREMNKSLAKEFDVCRGMPTETVGDEADKKIGAAAPGTTAPQAASSKQPTSAPPAGAGAKTAEAVPAGTATPTAH